MDYDEAIAFWNARVDFERKTAKPSDLKLEWMSDLLARLDNPQDQLAIVHIAGSKGKGSTAAMFASVGHAAGLRTGLYTSPHLVDVSERIQIDGRAISRDDIARLLTEMRPAIESLEAEGYQPSFFEIATAMAYLHFAQQKVQLAVIEVGLGGRFDATNVCTPLLSVITSISYEHTAILGDTLDQIAFEKAGIIKLGRPVVCGVTAQEARHVIERIAEERWSPLLQLGRQFDYRHFAGHPTEASPFVACPILDFFVHSERSRVLPAVLQPALNEPRRTDYALALLGSHQAANASLVVMGSRVLNSLGVPIQETAIQTGLATTRWPARMEVFPGRPLIALDCAHNVASAQSLAQTIRESFPGGWRVLLFASSNDKDVAGILRILADHFDRFIFTRFANSPRSLAPETIAEVMQSIRPNADVATVGDSKAALALARTDTSATIVIAGSVYLAGELRPLLVAR